MTMELFSKSLSALVFLATVGCSSSGSIDESAKNIIITEHFNSQVRIYHVRDRIDTLYFDERPFGNLDKVMVWKWDSMEESNFILNDSPEFSRLERRYFEVMKK